MVNSGIAKLMGQPHNISNGTGGRKTEAASRPKKNSTIDGGHFFGCRMYGTEGVGTGGKAKRGY